MADSRLMLMQFSINSVSLEVQNRGECSCLDSKVSIDSRQWTLFLKFDYIALSGAGHIGCLSY